MTLNEKAQFIKEAKEKNYLIISPRMIHGGSPLVYDYESLELYEKKDENTRVFAEKQILSLITDTNKSNKEISKELNLYLIFNGGIKDLPDDFGSFSEFIYKYKDNIIAIYKDLKNIEENHYFMDFDQTELIYNYKYIYLNFADLLKMFDENNIEYEIDTTINRNIPSMYRDDEVTKFKISYSKKKVKSKSRKEV